MLDIRFIRDNPDAVKRAAQRKGFNDVDIDRLLQLDADIRTAKQQLQDIATSKNAAGKQISQLTGPVYAIRLRGTTRPDSTARSGAASGGLHWARWPNGGWS